jgi:hypothetical protein
MTKKDGREPGRCRRGKPLTRSPHFSPYVDEVSGNPLPKQQQRHQEELLTSESRQQ